MNKVILIGRTTKEIDLRRTTNGNAVVSFTLAVDNPFQKNEEGKNTTDFINCVAWNKTAEIMYQYVSKGQKIAIEGRIQTRNYEDKDGKRVYVTEVLVSNLEMLEYVKKDTATEQNQNNYGTDLGQEEEYEAIDDDLPF